MDNDDALMSQINDLIQTRITKKLKTHDAMFDELSNQMTHLVMSMDELSEVANEATERETSERKEVHRKLKRAEEAQKKTMEKLVDGKMDGADITDKKAKKGGSKAANAKESKKKKAEKDAQMKSQIQGVGDKPRGRIVGKVVEQSMDGFIEEKKKHSGNSLTKFNAPRCASVGKGNFVLEKQREAQAMSQVKYPQCRSVVYAPTSDLDKKKVSQ